MRPRSIVRAATAQNQVRAELGTVREHASFMLFTQDELMASSATDQDLRPRARTLSWMASMSIAAGELRAAEGYLLELLAWCAFADRDVVDNGADF
ncbi:MAG: hypothetical protein WKG01_34150 [Kofleriaceae bacterium]